MCVAHVYHLWSSYSATIISYRETGHITYQACTPCPQLKAEGYLGRSSPGCGRARRERAGDLQGCSMRKNMSWPKLLSNRPITPTFPNMRAYGRLIARSSYRAGLAGTWQVTESVVDQGSNSSNWPVVASGRRVKRGQTVRRVKSPLGGKPVRGMAVPALCRIRPVRGRDARAWGAHRVKQFLNDDTLLLMARRHEGTGDSCAERCLPRRTLPVYGRMNAIRCRKSKTIAFRAGGSLCLSIPKAFMP